MIVQGFMGALVVVARAKGIEPALLRAAGRRGGPRGLAFQVAMHAFVRAVVLRTRRRNPVMHDPELHPPDVERGQAVQAGGGEGRAVIGPDRLGQADGAKQRAKHGAGLGGLDGGQPVTDEQRATEVIGHGQRIAVLPIAGFELAFEIGGPHLIRRVVDEGRRPGVRPSGGAGAGAGADDAAPAGR